MSMIELDFTNVEDKVGAVRVEPGAYMLRIVDAQDEDANGQPLMSKAGNRKWVMVSEFVSGEAAGSKLVTHISLTPQALWKVRELLNACGYKVPRGKLKVDPVKLLGRTFGAKIQDGEPFIGNDGKERVSSEIGFFLKPGWDNGAAPAAPAEVATESSAPAEVEEDNPALDEVDLDDLG